MDTRRAFFAAVFGTAAAAAAAGRTGLAQPAPAGPQQGRGGAADEGGLADRGAPAGRIGAATRSGAQSADGGLALDLVAPPRGVGLASGDQPTLFYLLSGRPPGPVRFAISIPGQARPLANVELPRAAAQSPGLAAIRLRDHGVRLPADVLCVWSVTVALDPRAPSRDLVASALIRHRPADPALDAALRESSPDRRVAALARAGFWYEAVALAEQGQSRDRGAALAWLFEQAELRTDALSGAAAATAR
jgi:hypothetical protein